MTRSTVPSSRAPRRPAVASLIALPLGLALLAGVLAGCGSYRPGQGGPSTRVEKTPSTEAAPPAPAGPLRDWAYAEAPAVPEGMKVHRRLKVITFGAGSASLDGEARGALGIAAEELAANPAWHALAVGHADNQGEKAGGQNLGQSRARAAAEFLRARGIAGDRLTVQSLGSTYAQGDSYALEQVRRDRQVEIWVFLR